LFCSSSSEPPNPTRLGNIFTPRAPAISLPTINVQAPTTADAAAAASTADDDKAEAQISSLSRDCFPTIVNIESFTSHNDSHPVQ